MDVDHVASGILDMRAILAIVFVSCLAIAFIRIHIYFIYLLEYIYNILLLYWPRFGVSPAVAQKQSICIGIKSSL